MLPVLIRANFQVASRFRLLLHSLLPIKSLQHIACGLCGGHRTLLLWTRSCMLNAVPVRRVWGTLLDAARKAKAGSRFHWKAYKPIQW